MSIHVAFLESLVAEHDTSLRFIEIATVRFIRYHRSFSYPLLKPELRTHNSKESQYWSQFPAYIWQPQRIKVRPVIGNGSDSFGWKIHDWIAVGTQFTMAHAGSGKKRGSYLGAPRSAGVTLIFHPWAREDMLTICKEHDVEAEQRFRLRQGSPDKSWAKLIAAFLRSRSRYMRYSMYRCAKDKAQITILKKRRIHNLENSLNFERYFCFL